MCQSSSANNKHISDKLKKYSVDSSVTNLEPECQEPQIYKLAPGQQDLNTFSLNINYNMKSFVRYINIKYTLVRLFMTGNIVAGKNNGGYKYGGIAEKPPNLTRRYFTCNIIFTKIFVNPPNLPAILQNSV